MWVMITVIVDYDYGDSAFNFNRSLLPYLLFTPGPAATCPNTPTVSSPRAQSRARRVGKIPAVPWHRENNSALKMLRADHGHIDSQRHILGSSSISLARSG